MSGLSAGFWGGRRGLSWGLRELGGQRKTQLQSKGTWENEHPTPQHSAQSWHHRSLNQHSAGTRSSTVQTRRAHRRGAFKGSEPCSVRTLSAVFTAPPTPYQPWDTESHLHRCTCSETHTHTCDTHRSYFAPQTGKHMEHTSYTQGQVKRHKAPS